VIVVLRIDGWMGQKPPSPFGPALALSPVESLCLGVPDLPSSHRLLKQQKAGYG